MRKKTIIFFTLLLQSIIFLSIGFCQADKLVVVSPGPGHPMYNIAVNILSETFQKMGQAFEFKNYPVLRAFHLIDGLEADCYLFGDSSFVEDHPTAIKIDVPLGYDEFFVYTKDMDFVPNGWNSLEPYSIGFQVGMLAVERKIKGMQTEGVRTSQMVFDKLSAGRNDLVVMPKYVWSLYHSNYPEIKMLEPSLGKTALYTFLNQKRANLASQLTMVLSELMQNGRIKAITDQVISDLERPPSVPTSIYDVFKVPICQGPEAGHSKKSVCSCRNHQLS